MENEINTIHTPPKIKQILIKEKLNKELDSKLLNKVTERFLPIAPSVKNGLEQEAKLEDFNIIQEISSLSNTNNTNKDMNNTLSIRILKVSHKVTKGVYALSVFSKNSYKSDKSNKLDKLNKLDKSFFSDVDFIYKINHPNAVKIYTHFEDDNSCYFVSEFVTKGNLSEKMKREKTLDNGTIVKYMHELISVLYYLHNMKTPIIHRDIRPENILIDDNNSIKLAKYPWSTCIIKLSNNTNANNNIINSNFSTYCGALQFISPEIQKEIGTDEYLDIWCLGVLMFQLLTGELPFTNTSHRANSDIQSGVSHKKINWPSDIDTGAKDLISKILNIKDRISLKEILNHPFFKKAKINEGELFRINEVK